MATVTPSRENHYAEGVVSLWKWGPLTTANLDGGWIKTPFGSDKAFHVYGTFGAGATVTIQGSNETDNPGAAGANAFVCHMVDGVTALTFLTAGGNAGDEFTSSSASNFHFRRGLPERMSSA